VQIGYPADLSASAASLAIACRDAGMPLLSGTDNGPSSTLRAFFSLYFIGLEREIGAILMVRMSFQTFQKATK
jgi:hypothetical protein